MELEELEASIDRPGWRGPRVLRRVRVQRRVPSLGAGITTDGEWDPGTDFVGAKGDRCSARCNSPGRSHTAT
jgi:hypothetical protein